MQFAELSTLFRISFLLKYIFLKVSDIKALVLVNPGNITNNNIMIINQSLFQNRTYKSSRNHSRLNYLKNK